MRTESPLVLIVEDNPADIALIAAKLDGAVSRGAFRLASASSMCKARRSLEQQDVAAVLLDLSLPDSLGIDTFHDILAAAPNTPIIVLTGLDDDQLGLECVRAGAQDYLVKGNADAVVLERTLNYALERKRRETSLRQRQSLDVMAQFADGIAHEFNNLLQTLLGQLQTLEWPLRDDEQLLEQVRAAGRTVLGGAQLTRRLLAVTGRLPDEPALIDTNAHIRRLCDSLRKSFGDSTRINLELWEDAWPVFSDPAKLDMVVLNLVNSAREAMLGRGEVTIRTSNLTVVEPNAAELPAGDYLMVEVIDIGDGLENDQRHLHDPFCRNGAEARLSGLGLNVTQNFLKVSGGHVAVRSVAGNGTTVALYLPRAETAGARPERVAGPSPAPTRHAQQVLVIEEDADVRKALSAYLFELGYPVFEAESAADAFAIIDSETRIDAVLVDHRGAGGIAGERLVSKMAMVQPDLGVLFMTNAAGEPLPEFDGPCREVVALPKPARRCDLENCLTKLLQPARSAA